MRVALLGLLALLGRAATAHIVPVAPSTCTLDMGLRAPALGLVATVDPPASGELVRVSYDPDGNPARSRMQVCPADPGEPSSRCADAFAPRGFVLDGVPGTIRLPTAFSLRLLANGDLSALAVPIDVTLGGAAPVSVPFELATGLLLVGTAPVAGAPLDASGAFTLVGSGVSNLLAPPLAGSALELRLSCTLSPTPDLDQFALSPRLTKVRGVLTTKRARLVLLLESEVTLPADFVAEPTLLRLGPADAPLLEAVVTLAAASRGRFASDDGSIVVAPVRSRTSRLMKLVLRRAIAPDGPYVGREGAVAISSGGLQASRPVTLKANRRGTRLLVRER
jgi:hypothetical protein